MAEQKQPTLGPAAQAIYNNSQDSMRRRISIQVNSLQPEMYRNFQEIVDKYPGMSKDLVMAMVSQGLTVNTPGIGKIVSLDGISQLKNDTSNLDKIKSTVKRDRGFVGALNDTFKEAIYDPFKGATRLTFAALRHPYDTLTAAVRDISVGKMPSLAYGKESTLVSLLKDTFGGEPGVDTGSGFFINPESRVGKDQAKAMSSYGRVFGESFTIGRFAAKSVGLTPDQAAYRVMSGLVDATLNVGFDPTTWMAFGPLSKGARQSRKITEMVKAAEPFNQPVAKRVAVVDDAIKDLERKRFDLIKKNAKRVEDRVLSKERKLLAIEKEKSEALSKTLSDILNVAKASGEGIKSNPLAQETLSVDNITKYILNHDKVQSGELVRGIGKLGADVKNTKGFAEGNIILDELPAAGKLSIGVHGLDEYFVTALTDEPLKVLDLNADLGSFTGKEFQAEQLRRTQFLDSLKAIADDTSIEGPIRDIFTDVTKMSQEDIMALRGYAWATLFNDQPSNFRTLADIFRRIGESGSVKAVQLAYDEMAKIWDWDAIANVRSIYGETGGFLLNGTKPYFGLAQAEIGNAFAEIADPTNLGPNILKLMQGLKSNDETVAKLQADLEKARFERDAFDSRVKELDIFREVANQDIETATRYLSDPQYKGLRKIIEINAELSEKRIMREWISSQVGITDYFGGNLADDFSKPLKYLLGRNFSRIAEIVAKESDPVKIQRFFGNKLDADTVKLLAAAKTPDEVLGTFLSLLNPDMADIQVFRSLALRAQTGLLANPAMKLVDSSDVKLVKVAEKLDRAFGRFFVRSTTINLGDLSRTIEGVENWISSAKFKVVLGAKAQEAFIDDLLGKIYKAESAVERGAVIEKGMVELTKMLSARMGLNAEQSAEIAKVIKLGSAEKNIIEQYSTIQRAMGEEPTFVFAGDAENAVSLGKAVSLDQMLKSTAFLPDSQAIMKAFLRFESAKLKHGVRAIRALAEELGDIWRTAQLAFRVSYILRNIGEMQVRQMFSGHASIFSHPIQFISFIMATSGKNGPMNKFAQKIGRYQFDALGNKWTSELTEGDLMDAVKGYQLQIARKESVSDYQQSRKAEIFKTYSMVDVNSPEYFEGLSFVLNRWAVDDLYPAVARLMQLGDEDAKKAFVKRLVSEFDKPGNPIRDLTFGAFEKNPGIKRIFLVDPDKAPSKDNLHPERIFAYLFDETPGNETYANRIKAVAGNGSAANIIMDIIGGEAKIATEGGNFVTLKSPWLTGGAKTPAQLGILEDKFKKVLASTLKPENLTNSTVIVQKPVYAMMPGGKKLTEWVDKFFGIAAKFEGKYNFGPEYIMSYWDTIGKYAGMLSVDDLKKLQPNAVKALAPISKVIGGKTRTLGPVNPTLKIIEKEIKKREASGALAGTHTLENINSIAATEASKRVAGLFYDAARQKQWAQAARLVFPFAQAHTNTIYKWGQLAFTNPIPVYRFAKAFDALTKQGSNTIYDVTGMTYDDDQGFFYKDPNTDDLKFKMPLVGSVLGALTGKNVDMREALQITAPVQSLNLAFGQVNPFIPGFGPAAQIAFTASGRANQFGSGYDVLRDIITPFGPIQGPEDVVFPSWLKKLVLYRMGDSATINRNIKEWASYLASTGKYGEDPLSNDAVRNKLFNDAESLSKSIGMWTAFFQSISPATPQIEVLAKIKNPDNKMKFMTGTILYQYWNKIQEENPGDYGAAVRQLGDTFGLNNILIALSESTSSVTGTDDAWTFLNNNPQAADLYAKSTSDIVPYFFPGGGEFAVKYYNWQKRSGVRKPLSADDLEREAEGMIYAMRKDQIADEQIVNGYTQFWYVDQIAKLDAEFGGKPPEVITTSSAYEKIDRIGKALQDPAFAESPVYSQVSEFYPMFVEYQKELNRLNVSNYASLKSKGGYATILRDNLVAMAENLMAENPSFRRMYYGVFAGQLEG